MSKQSAPRTTREYPYLAANLEYPLTLHRVEQLSRYITACSTYASAKEQFVKEFSTVWRSAVEYDLDQDRIYGLIEAALPGVLRESTIIWRKWYKIDLTLHPEITEEVRKEILLARKNRDMIQKRVVRYFRSFRADLFNVDRFNIFLDYSEEYCTQEQYDVLEEAVRTHDAAEAANLPKEPVVPSILSIKTRAKANEMVAAAQEKINEHLVPLNNGAQAKIDAKYLGCDVDEPPVKTVTYANKKKTRSQVYHVTKEIGDTDDEIIDRLEIDCYLFVGNIPTDQVEIHDLDELFFAKKRFARVIRPELLPRLRSHQALFDIIFVEFTKLHDVTQKVIQRQNFTVVVYEPELSIPDRDAGFVFYY
jgi:hypothetical protein